MIGKYITHNNCSLDAETNADVTVPGFFYPRMGLLEHQLAETMAKNQCMENNLIFEYQLQSNLSYTAQIDWDLIVFQLSICVIFIFLYLHLLQISC